MTDAAVTPLLLVGDPAAAACVGDACEIPVQRDQAVVNRRLDADDV
jgi:hypothetical protein